MDVADFWTQSWTSDDRVAVRQMLAPDAEIEWNLNAPADEEELVQTLHRIAVFAEGVTVLGRTRAEDGVALSYDLVAPFGRARMMEFLTIADARITEVRQIYDVVAIDRYFPGLYAQ